MLAKDPNFSGVVKVAGQAFDGSAPSPTAIAVYRNKPPEKAFYLSSNKLITVSLATAAVFAVFIWNVAQWASSIDNRLNSIQGKLSELQNVTERSQEMMWALRELNPTLKFPPPKPN